MSVFNFSLAVTPRLICVYVFAYADCWFSHEGAQIVINSIFNCDTLYSFVDVLLCVSNILLYEMAKKPFYMYKPTSSCSLLDPVKYVNVETPFALLNLF